ncbi:MAG: hypothetical protein U9Q27_00165 [Patescibacteria group bacterium]|nr:hypothetical protein [Patescibacteria group bacterium]
MAFRRGVTLKVFDSSILISNSLGKDYSNTQVPMTIAFDLGICVEYNKVIDPEGLIEKVRNFVNF